MCDFFHLRACTLLEPSTTPTTTVTTTPTTTTPEVCTNDCFDCGFHLQTCQLVPGTRCSFKCMSKTPEICTNSCLDCGYMIGSSCQLIPFTQCSFKCMRTPPEERCPTVNLDCGIDMKCRDKPGLSCQLVPGTRCSVRCMRTFTATTTFPRPPNTTPEGPTHVGCIEACFGDSYCPPGYSCQSYGQCSSKCLKTPTTVPTPLTTTPTTAPPMMTIEMCLLPGNEGRSSGRPLANLGFEVVVVQCRSYETCVESDNSKILGNPLG